MLHVPLWMNKKLDGCFRKRKQSCLLHMSLAGNNCIFYRKMKSYTRATTWSDEVSDVFSPNLSNGWRETDWNFGHNEFDLKLSPWPWSDLSQTCALHIISWNFTFVPTHFEISFTFQELESRYIYSHTMFDLELWHLSWTLVTYTHCTWADTKYSHTLVKLELWLWPWPDLGQIYAQQIDLSYLTFVQFFENPTKASRDIERTRNTVIQCLTFNYDIDLEPTLVNHMQCTLTHHSWHVCRVIWKSHHDSKRYKVDTKYSHTMVYL